MWCFFLVLTSTKQRIKCLAEGLITVPLVRLEPATLNLKSSTLPLSHCAPHVVGQWPSSRVLDFGSKVHLFETHESHCVVFLRKTLYPLLSTGSTQEDRKSSLGRAVAAWLETGGPRVRVSLTLLRCGPWARHIYPSLVLVQPRKTRPYISERLLMGRKESNQTNKLKEIVPIWLKKCWLICKASTQTNKKSAQ